MMSSPAAARAASSADGNTAAPTATSIAVVDVGTAWTKVASSSSLTKGAPTADANGKGLLFSSAAVMPRQVEIFSTLEALGCKCDERSTHLDALMCVESVFYGDATGRDDASRLAHLTLLARRIEAACGQGPLLNARVILLTHPAFNKWVLHTLQRLLLEFGATEVRVHHGAAYALQGAVAYTSVASSPVSVPSAASVAIDDHGIVIDVGSSGFRCAAVFDGYCVRSTASNRGLAWAQKGHVARMASTAADAPRWSYSKVQSMFRQSTVRCPMQGHSARLDVIKRYVLIEGGWTQLMEHLSTITADDVAALYGDRSTASGAAPLPTVEDALDRLFDETDGGGVPWQETVVACIESLLDNHVSLNSVFLGAKGVAAGTTGGSDVSGTFMVCGSCGDIPGLTERLYLEVLVLLTQRCLECTESPFHQRWARVLWFFREMNVLREKLPFVAPCAALCGAMMCPVLRKFS